MKTKINSLLFFLLFFPLCLMAQNTVKGTVTEQSSSLPLPSVNVIIKDTAKGTATDFDGNYEVNVNNGDVLVFSYIGFINQEIVYNGQQTINISLVEDASSLDEVVVIGYGSVKKEDLTGSVNLITSKDFNDGPVVSAGQLISGKIAGVNVTSGGGAPGEGQSITIRGNGSLKLSSNPLIVLDGHPLEGSVGGGRDGLNLINPNDIESMTVLKDASATAIYGARGANGVIIVTSKKGKDRDFKFNVNTSTIMHSPTNQVDVLSSNQFRSLVNDTNDVSAISKLGNANTNWQDEIYTAAFGQDHNISALGSIFREVPLRASVGYTDHDGILKGDEFQRTTAALSLTPKLLDDHLTIQLNARGAYTENKFANRDAIGNAVSFDPTQSVFDSSSQYAGYFSWIDPSTGNQQNLGPRNPVALLDLIDDTTEIRRFIGNAKFDYKLHFFPDLTATINVGLDKANSHGRKVTSEFIPIPEETFNGSRTTSKGENTNKLFDAYLTYNKTLKDIHNLIIVAGHSYQSNENKRFTYDSELEEEAIANPSDNIQYEFDFPDKDVTLSYFGRLNYAFKDKYLLTGTLRADATSKIKDSWGYFPSAAAAWKIHKENFLKDSFFEELKLRIGYGEMGNSSGLLNYKFLTRYVSSQSTANYQFGYNQDGSPAFYQTYRPEPLNENLKWEVGRTTNIGLDFGFFNKRLTGSVDAYLKETKDLIVFASVDPFTNFANRVEKNIGDMENKGIEIALNVIPVQTEDIEWSINYNIAFNDNTITSLPFDQPTGGISGGVGNNVQIHTEGETPYSYYVFQQVYDTNGIPIEGAYVDRNGDNVINDDDKYIYKDPYADIIMGLNTNLSYKKWDFAMVTRANIGNYAYDNVASSNAYYTRATENNILTNLHSDYYNTGFQNTTEGNLLSNHFVKEASFFKIDNITLGYTLDKAIKDTTLRVYGSLQNVATITDYDGLDPEISGGIDNNFYPRPRSFVLGVNIDF